MEQQNYDAIWASVVEQVKTHADVNPSQADAVLARLTLQAFSDGFCIVTADNAFMKGWVEKNFLDHVYRALEELRDVPFTVVLDVDESAAAQTAAPAPQPATTPQADQGAADATAAPVKAAAPAPRATGAAGGFFNIPNPFARQTAEPEPEPQQEAAPEAIAPEPNDAAEPEAPVAASPTSSMTFSNFVIADTNRIAYEMAVSVAEKPGCAHLNPLFIYGKSGLGKTHLMRAIQNYIQETQPHLKTVYVDTNELVAGYADATAARDTQKSSYKHFKAPYESADVLLVDDVQILERKPGTLDIVFQIFNKLTDNGKQIVLSADRAPKNIDMDERYTTRFNRGGTFDIQPPNVETKVAIIKSYIDEFRLNEGDETLDLPDDVQAYIAEVSGSNIRELKSAVTILFMRMKGFHTDTISLAEAKSLLENHFTGGPSRRVTPEDIQKQVEGYYRISHADIIGKKRSRDIVLPRQVAIYLIREMTDLSLQDIGRLFGGRDHTTVMNSIEATTKRLHENTQFREDLDTLKGLVREALS
ncbi:chromosomal replication initiator protein DnaA [Eggerthellaceae bacterium zg-887]|uniref:chromosomal replication initiator protein DnaA n=1 Tax=Xiamenia xianingshaonis TaxID=2682776 RepID=UPI001407B88C|nr:chromosomal replication initiator protein DnaA [Xiamenia xianingshaonis]NHM16405.1 chromosomal replication initiator protein DnaA [Xiamenia xianingshaonis]